MQPLVSAVAAPGSPWYLRCQPFVLRWAGAHHERDGRTDQAATARSTQGHPHHHLALPGGPARPRLSSAYLAKRRTLALTKLLALKVGLLAVACGFKRVINLVIDNHAQCAAPLHFVRPH